MMPIIITKNVGMMGTFYHYLTSLIPKNMSIRTIPKIPYSSLDQTFSSQEQISQTNFLTNFLMMSPFTLMNGKTTSANGIY